MLNTTMKLVEKFDEDILPSEVAEAFERISNNCYSAFGKAGNVKTIKLDEDANGDRTLIAIVEVEN